MAYRRLLALFLLLILSGCGVMVIPGAEQDSWSRGTVTNHRVQKGETLYSIAYRYGVEYRTLAGWNKIRPPYRIFIGQQLTLKPQIVHQVKSGETLYAIAFRYGVDFRSLAKTNRIKSPYRIFVGDKITVIPQANSPSKVTPIKSKVNKPTRATVVKASGSSKGSRTTARTSKPQVRTKTTRGGRSSSNRKVFWGWPARGKLVTTFSPKDHRKGIDIRGKVGNNVVAAEGGDVVYSGNGLLGYGNLIIIRHNSSYLSAYGHNRKLLVKEGTKVTKGQKIAEMGRTRKKGAILHFEIRRNGKPVNPVRYLPRL